MDQPEPESAPALPGRNPLVRRVAMIVAGLVVIGGAVAVLRTPEQAADTPKPPPPPQTTVREFAKDGVVVPAPGNAPAMPAGLTVQPGNQRLLVAWGPQRTPHAEPDRAAGYEIRWGSGPTLTYTRLVSQPVAQLDALENGQSYAIEVRTVDAFGKRSLPAMTSAVPQAAADEPAWSFVDQFDTRVVPDPVRWRLAGSSDCGRATRGEGHDGRRLVVSGQCGSEPLVLRPRAQFRTHDAPVDGEWGRLVVETDHPGQTGELTIDLVPGPADLIDGSPNGSPRPGAPGFAQDDPSLPPGTIRVRVDGGITPTAQVLVAPGTPRLGAAVAVEPMPPAEIGISVRWEVVLRTDGVRVLRDGRPVAGGDIAPPWREATVLLGFTGGPTGLHAAIDMVGYLGGPTAPPVLVAFPVIDTGGVIIESGKGPLTPSGGPLVRGAVGGQVRAALLPTNALPANDQFTVEVGGREFPARPAVPGQPLIRGVRYPIVADIPAEALVLRADSDTLPLRVRGPMRPGESAARVLHASIELHAPEGAASAASGSGTDVPLSRTRLALARPSARFLDAAGQSFPEGESLPRGRVVLEVTADAQGGQRLGGELAGLAGIEIRLDGERIAGIPTIVDGPGTGGVWRVALNASAIPTGMHTIEIKAIGVDPKAAFAVAYLPFTVAP